MRQSIVGPTRREILVPLLILIVGVSTFVLLSFEFVKNIERGARLQFERNASDTQHVIEARIAAYTDVVRGLRALFETQDAVSRVQFHDYVSSLDLKRRYPGFEVLNYAVQVGGRDREKFEASMRRDTSLNPAGYPAFAIQPPGERPEYHVLIYLEPMVESSLGRDIYAASPAAAAIMGWARDTGEVAMSGRPVPVLKNRIIGLAARLAVYQRGMPVATAEQRRAAYIGSVGAGFNIATLMQDVLPKDASRDMRFALVDAGHIDPGNVGVAAPGAGLIYDSKAEATTSPLREKIAAGQFFATVLPMTVGGRKWDIHFSAPKEAFISGTQEPLPRMVMVGGLLSSILLSGMVYALMSSRRRAVGIAHAMTKDLRESKQLLQALFDNSTAIIFVKDLEGRYLLVNRHLEEIFHKKRHTVVGLTTYDLFPKEYADALCAFDARVIEAGRALDAEEIVPQDDGLHTYLSIKAPLFDEAGKPYAICAISTDITDRKRAELELKRHRDHLEDLVRERTTQLIEAKDKAEVANQAKSTFLASMSHELRTPLNAILGYAQILRREQSLGERQKIGLDTIRQSGEHLLTLINDILDLAKIEAGKIELYPVAFNLPVFLRVIADIIRVKAEQKSLLFMHEISPDTPRAVCADEKRLRQVLLNLLGNAVKFTDRGQVSLRVHCLSGCAGDDVLARLRFDIEDSGVGLAPEQLSKIFLPFEQVGDTERRAGGTGLGLAISRQLVRLMDSDIQVESRPGQGSRFWFELSMPVAPEAPAVPAERNVSGYQGPHKKILIVDDVVANRAMLVDLLSDLGFDTAEAANGQDALERMPALRPDLIVMDMVMPVMNGLQATHCIRQLPEQNRVPIIAVSASAAQEDQAASLAAGANAFLAKPIDQTNLLKQIGVLLDLNWIDEQPQESAAAENAPAGPLIAPPRQELQALYELAQAGNMGDIRDWATKLAARDQRYVPFAAKLCGLATRYQSKSILDLVEEYLSRTGPDNSK